MEELIESGEKVKETLLGALMDLEDYLQEQGKPKGYSKGTSYQDYDVIHGSREELHSDMYQIMADEGIRLNNMLIIQEKSLDRYYIIKKEVDRCLNDVMGVNDKVSILRERFSQEEVAELIDKSVRTIQRIDKENKENILKHSIK